MATANLPYSMRFLSQYVSHLQRLLHQRYEGCLISKTIVSLTKQATFMSDSLEISKLSQMIKSKRGAQGLRKVAEDIGDVSASTLSRIEQGNLPDIDTFLKICKWLEVSPDFFTIKNQKEDAPKQKEVVAFLRADRTLSKETATALIKMINLAYESSVHKRIRSRNKT